MKHKWHEEIKAWADGAEIEYKNSFDPTISGWQTVANPDWVGLEFKFRIKPQPKQPKYLYAYIFNGTAMLTETKAGAANGGRYIGKIEVNDD